MALEIDVTKVVENEEGFEAKRFTVSTGTLYSCVWMLFNDCEDRETFHVGFVYTTIVVSCSKM